MSSRLDFFISYDTDDVDSVREIADQLDARGHPSWMAKSRIRSGHWRTKVEEALDSASCFLLMLSARTATSREVENEFRRATTAGKPTLLVYLEECRPPLYAASLHATRYYIDPDLALTTMHELVVDAREIRRLAELQYLTRVAGDLSDQASNYFPLDFNQVNEGITSAPDIASLVQSALARYEPDGESKRGVADLFDLNNDVSERKRRRFQLTGESGAGKSSTLARLAFEMASRAATDVREPIPILISLKSYRGTRPLVEQIRLLGARRFPELVPYLDELFAENRVCILLDGLNEIPQGQSNTHTFMVQQFLAKHQDIPVAVASVSADYTPERGLGLDVVEIRRLNPLQIRRFIGLYTGDDASAQDLFWSMLDDSEARTFLDQFLRLGGDEETFWLHKGPTPSQLKHAQRPFFQWDLWIAIRDDPLSLLNLAGNPYLLYLMVQVFLAKGSLPASRYDLLSVFFQVMYETGGREGQGNRGPTGDQRGHASLLAKLAVEMHQRGVQALPRSEVEVLLGDDAETFLATAEDERLIDPSDEVTFSHPLLREYFATDHVEQLWRSGERFAQLCGGQPWWQPSGWEESAILLAGKFAADPTRFLTWLRDDHPELASLCIIRESCQTTEVFRQSLATAWLRRLTDSSERPAARAAIGRALGRLNIDSRPGVTVVDNRGLPVIEWVPIAETDLAEGEKISRFQISKYMVTNAQYEPFVAAGGYLEGSRGLWTEEGWGWRVLANRTRPDDYTEVFRLPNHPRIGTVWYEVVAFTNWLTVQFRKSGDIGTSELIRLPTELEWERAARGQGMNLAYPWGDEFDYDRCNVRDIRSTCAVGLYESGASIEGVFDLVGNAWTWCMTKWNADIQVQDNDLRGDEARVYRGGSWAFDFNVSAWQPEELRADQRYWIDPLDDRPDAIGFFVVRDQCSTDVQSPTK